MENFKKSSINVIYKNCNNASFYCSVLGTFIGISCEGETRISLTEMYCKNWNSNRKPQNPITSPQP